MIKRLFLIAALVLVSGEAFAASGCNYPSSLDSYANKVTGDFLTVADINSRSCAIEQLEARLNQVFSGISGGQTVTGGTGASQNLVLRSTAHATKGGIILGSAAVFNEATNFLGIGTLSPSRRIHVIAAPGSAMMLQVDGGSIGPRLDIFHNGTSNDAGGLFFYSLDGTSTIRSTNYIQSWYLDGTAGSQDSELRFCTQNNAAADCNTFASLSSLGVWTDSSTEVNKQYEGDIPGGAINSLKKLTTFGVYRAKDLPAGKVKNARRHYSPTAEDFNKATGLGTSTGIAPKDAAFLAAKAVLELDARVSALEKATRK